MALSGETPRDGAEARTRGGPGLRRILVIAGAAALALMIVGLGTRLFLSGPTASAAALAEIDARVAALGIPQADIAPTISAALQVRRAILVGDFTTAGQLVEGVASASTIQSWRFYPFADFVAYVSDRDPPDMKTRLDEWVAADPASASAHLLRAQYAYNAGWVARGNGFASAVGGGRMTAFARLMGDALADVEAAIRLDPANPYLHFQRLRILQGGGASDAFFGAFSEGIAAFPNYYPLYEIALTTLQPRWGGTVESMIGFVDEFAGKAPEGSPLKLLYLSLYRHLVGTAAMGCKGNGGSQDAIDQCVASFMATVAPKTAEANVLTALALYDGADPVQFGLAIRPIIADLLDCDCTERYAGAVLQLAATSMHSNTRLKTSDPGASHYVIDLLAARSFKARGFEDNADAKYQEALLDAGSMTFANPDERRIGLAGIYEVLSDNAERDNRFVDEVVYGEAAVRLGVPWFSNRVCHGYAKLELYDRAVEACTAALDTTGNVGTRFWRAVAYNSSSRTDLAVADFTEVANTADDYFGARAVIELSMIHFNRNDLQGALAVLNAHPYAYDPDVTDESTVAVAYNNRCYAYMELGEYQKALDDCTQSLRYGSMPEAFSKQQELVALLKRSE